jgi:hypothetical protein
MNKLHFPKDIAMRVTNQQVIDSHLRIQNKKKFPITLPNSSEEFLRRDVRNLKLLASVHHKRWIGARPLKDKHNLSIIDRIKEYIKSIVEETKETEMTKFIEVTTKDDMMISININSISAFMVNEGDTIICVKPSSEFCVKESYEDVRDLIIGNLEVV